MTTQNKITFEINPQQYDQYLKWRREIDKNIILKEIENGRRLCDGEVLNQKQINLRKQQLANGKVTVYYGAIEHGYIFTFVPTSVLDVIRVKNTLTGDEIDLTDYDNW